jgi:serine protease Do
MSTHFIHRRGWTTLLSVAAILIIGVLAGSLVTAKTGRAPFGVGNTVPILVATSSPVTAGQISFGDGFSAVVKKVQPAVVNIASTKVVRSSDRGPSSPFFSDPFFRQFFGDQFDPLFRVPREQREHSLGSGVIVNTDGYLLTNNHVVQDANDIKISLSDKRELKAKVIGTDPKTDIAVLKVEAKNLPVVVFGDSSKVEVGQFALALGNPFGIGQTVTMGIVSAIGRGGLGIEDYEDFIQTDAAINPGNSGGALVNSQGELIGINTAILTGGGGGNQGVGFAVPIAMAQQVMEQILQHGKVVRGWLGVVVQPVNTPMAKAFGLKDPHGALIGDVKPDSPAARAGLQKGDIVLELDGKPVTDSRDLSLRIGSIAPGSDVKLKVFRSGTERELTVRLGEMPAKMAQTPGQKGSAGRSLEGLSVDELTSDVARQIGLPPGTKGVVVTDVQPGSAVAEAGLRRGDVIQQVNHKTVTNVNEFQGALSQGGEPVLLLINRGGNTLYVVVERS